MLLIGSRSLQTHIALDRDPDDWDLFLRLEEFEKIKDKYPRRQLNSGHCHMYVGKDTLEIHIIHPQDTTTDGMLLSIAEQSNYPMIDTPIGLAHNASIEMHKLLKLSSYGLLNKPKNYRDLASLKNVEILWPEILEQRIQETVKRKEKRQFFDRYAIRRFVDHDQLHTWVTEALGKDKPTFEKVIQGQVEVTPELFNVATLNDKLYSMMEEAIVLGIERWFLPNLNKQTNAISMWQKFSLANTSTDPALRWLDKLCFPGSIKDHPDWLAEWGQENYLDLKGLLQVELLNIKSNMPKEFWTLVDNVKNGKIKPIEQ